MKKCTKCGESRPATEFYRRENGRIRNECKPCWQRQTAANVAPKRAASKAARNERRVTEKARRLATSHKSCTQCGTQRDVSEFHKRKASIDGLSPICKACAIANQAARYRANPEQCRAVGRAWYQKNRTRAALNRKRWMDENREHYLATKRDYARQNKQTIRESQRRCARAKPNEYAEKQRRHYEANRAKYRAKAQRWRREHPEEYSLGQANRRARVRGAGDDRLTLREWRQILEVFGHRCAYCLKPLVRATKDHVDPIARGGRNVADNVVPACGSCNSRKSARTLAQMVMAGHGVVSNGGS